MPQCFASLKLANWLEYRLLLPLKDSTGLNWHEVLPNDLNDPVCVLEGVSTEDSGFFVLSGSQVKFSQQKFPLILGRRGSSLDHGSCLCHFSLVVQDHHFLFSILGLLDLLWTGS